MSLRATTASRAALWQEYSEEQYRLAAQLAKQAGRTAQERKLMYDLLDGAQIAREVSLYLGKITVDLTWERIND